MVPVSASIKMADSAPTTGPVGQFWISLDCMSMARCVSRRSSASDEAEAVRELFPRRMPVRIAVIRYIERYRNIFNIDYLL